MESTFRPKPFTFLPLVVGIKDLDPQLAHRLSLYCPKEHGG